MSLISLAAAALLALGGCTGQKPAAPASLPLPAQTTSATTVQTAPAMSQSTGAPSPLSSTARPAAYRIGVDDVLEISITNDPDLDKTQIVRPDGKIAVPLVGEIQAAGRTPEEVRQHIARELARYFREPSVTVIVVRFENRKVSIVGEVNSPGVFEFRSSMRLLDVLALAGGLTPDADLGRAVVVRDGQILPVSVENLMRYSDFSQNILLNPNDAVLIPDVFVNRILVLGEVANPSVITLRKELRVLESIVLAKGFTDDAEKGAVLVVRGGLERPVLYKIDAQGILERGDLGQNIVLETGDIVYVSKSRLAAAVDLFANLRVIIQTFLAAESSLILLPEVWNFLTTGITSARSNIVVGQ